MLWKRRAYLNIYYSILFCLPKYMSAFNRKLQKPFCLLDLGFSGQAQLYMNAEVGILQVQDMYVK